MAENPILQLKNLHFGFPGKKVLKGLNLDLNPGDMLGIIGESGSGKTSLLRVLAGFANPNKGHLYFKGQKLPPAQQMLIPGYENIKLVHQDFDLMPMLTVEENIIRQLKHLSNSQQQQRALQLRKLLGLSGLRNRRADQLSGGQRQRIAIATAVASQPQVLLLDEAFSNLDYSLKRKILTLLKTEWRPGLLVVVGHEPAELLSLCNLMIVLQHGKLIQDESPRKVYRNPVNLYAGKLLGPITEITAGESEKLGWTAQDYLLRPFQLMAAEKGLQVTIEECEFTGRDYLCTAISPAICSKIYFYHPTNISNINKVDLIVNQ